jgi:hypothetical protein
MPRQEDRTVPTLALVSVIEKWRLRDEFADRALELMQQMDDIVGPGAHSDDGWVEHGRFFQLHSDPAEIWMMYRWRGRPAHEVFIRQEESILQDFYQKYCVGPREIVYFDELPVDVEGAEHGSTGDPHR